MCRFVAYLGEPILAEDLITRPINSLINQSYQAQETSEPLNGDGFGLGWYAKKIRPEPGLYKSITPAWNDQNLRVNAGIIKSNCLMAHVRAATEGEVALQNNHPFRHKQYLMMHNGGIMDFGEIKRDLINLLSNHYYQWIYGATDSEHVFALFMQTIANLSEGKEGDELSLDFLAGCFERTFEQIEELKDKRGVTSPSVYNMVVTDGARMLATRYSTDPDNESRTLYYAKGRKYVCEGNVCKMLPDNGASSSILVASEKLDEFKEEWVPVEDNKILMIDRDCSISLVDIGVVKSQ